MSVCATVMGVSSLFKSFLKDVECLELFAGAQEVTGALRGDCCLIDLRMLLCV